MWLINLHLVNCYIQNRFYKTRALLKLERTMNLLSHWREGGREGGRAWGREGGMPVIHILIGMFTQSTSRRR